MPAKPIKFDESRLTQMWLKREIDSSPNPVPFPGCPTRLAFVYKVGSNDLNFRPETILMDVKRTWRGSYKRLIKTVQKQNAAFYGGSYKLFAIEYDLDNIVRWCSISGGPGHWGIRALVTTYYPSAIWEQQIGWIRDVGGRYIQVDVARREGSNVLHYIPRHSMEGRTLRQQSTITAETINRAIQERVAAIRRELGYES